MKFSNRIKSVQESPIRKLVPIADRAEKDGKKVYYLNIGQPDIETPREFFEAVNNFDRKVLEYSSSHGLTQLLEAFSDYYDTKGIDFAPEDIIITNGGSEALLFSLMVLCDYGDEVIIPEPFYANYSSFTSSLGVKVSPFITKAEDGFHLPSREAIASLVNANTKALLISNPGNPTGTVYTREEVRMLADIAIEHDLFIIADEVYREFIYTETEFLSFAHLEDLKDRVVIVDSISKRFSSCGARIGCVASKNREFIFEFLKLCQSRLCVSTINQVGAAALSKVSHKYLDDAVTEYHKRRDILYSALKDMDGVICREPEGAFYIIAKLPVDNSEDFVVWLLEEFDVDGETVFVAPAEGFYETEGSGLDEVRISYVLETESLKKAMNILREGLSVYPKRKN